MKSWRGSPAKNIFKKKKKKQDYWSVRSGESVRSQGSRSQGDDSLISASPLTKTWRSCYTAERYEQKDVLNSSKVAGCAPDPEGWVTGCYRDRWIPYWHIKGPWSWLLELTFHQQVGWGQCAHRLFLWHPLLQMTLHGMQNQALKPLLPPGAELHPGKREALQMDGADGHTAVCLMHLMYLIKCT